MEAAFLSLLDFNLHIEPDEYYRYAAEIYERPHHTKHEIRKIAEISGD